MNVLYIGVKNPVSISAFGYPDNRVTASIGNGTIEKNGTGKYIVNPYTPGKTEVVVNVRTDDGTTRSFKHPFRVMRIPTPDIYCGSKNGQVISKGEIGAQEGIIARLDEFVFTNVPFKIQGFEMIWSKRGKETIAVDISKSGRFTDTMKEVLRNRLRAGDRVLFTDIRVLGPDGKVRMLDASFKIIS